MFYRHLCLFVLGICGMASFPLSSDAHFTWISIAQKDGEPVAKLHFSEAAHVAGAHLPEKVGQSKLLIWDAAGTKSSTEMKRVESDDSVHLEGNLSENIPCSAESSCTYGIYHSFLLTYHPKAIYIKNRSDLRAVARGSDQKLDIIPAWHEYGLEVTVNWNGRPVADAEIAISDPDEKELEITTNKEGRALITNLKPGLYGMRTHYVMPDSAGEHEGQKYDEQQHFATLTLSIPPAEKTTDKGAKAITIPNPIASFGAAIHGGYLYVYGGHTGRAHSHSRQNLSPHFRRIYLKGRGNWEELPMQSKLQGLALVAHGKYLYRIGGLSARNEIDDEPDLHSVNEFNRFDTETLTWQRLPDLPQGRSSHDAVIVGNTLFVVGGWELTGDSDGLWHDTAIKIDLSADNPLWQIIEKVPFERRALATATLKNKIYVLCGMDSYGEIVRAVNIYDPEKNLWTEGPEFPGDEMDGFGISAWGTESKLLATGLDGVVYGLSEDQSQWESLTKLERGRFFHRMLPASPNEFVMVGGASLSGHIDKVDFFAVPH